MIQKYHQTQQLHESSITVPEAVRMLCLSKIVLTLDDIPLGYLTAEENNTMTVIDYNDGNKFGIPSCKVITVINGNFNKLFVDLEHHEAEKYRIK
jgi:hypothetical protein